MLQRFRPLRRMRHIGFENGIQLLSRVSWESDERVGQRLQEPMHDALQEGT